MNSFGKDSVQRCMPSPTAPKSFRFISLSGKDGASTRGISMVNLYKVSHIYKAVSPQEHLQPSKYNKKNYYILHKFSTCLIAQLQTSHNIWTCCFCIIITYFFTYIIFKASIAVGISSQSSHLTTTSQG